MGRGFMNKYRPLPVLVNATDPLRATRSLFEAVPPGYVRKVLASYTNETRKFNVLVLLMYADDQLIGFAFCKVVDRFASLGYDAASLKDHKGLIVFIDLICGSPLFKYSTQRLMQEVLRQSVKMGARLVVLEALPKAASFYKRFGFARGPNACDPTLQGTNNFGKYLDSKAKRNISNWNELRNIVNHLNAHDNVYFKGFDHDEIVMSRCITQADIDAAEQQGVPVPRANVGEISRNAKRARRR